MDAVEQQHLNDALSLTQRLAGVGTLTASVAHELTNPLSIITTACGNLLQEVEEGTLDEEDLIRYIDLIEQSAFRSARIVAVLRNYTHLDGPEIAVTTVQMLVRDSLTLVEQQFRKEANVTIEVAQATDLRSIVCDHNRIVQVLVNLLSNARDAMQPEGGTIQLKFFSIVDDEEVNEHNKQAPKQFAFTVRDSGHGIDPQLMDKIFQPFFTTKPNGKGTGLGLYIVQGIIEQHNGRLWAENNPEGGATFTVVLPQRQP